MRLYSIDFEDISVSAAQDLLNITATANMALRLHSIEIGQRSLTSWEAKNVRLQRFPATVTAGSGGAAVTPRPLNNGDAAATFTSRRNDTTGMTTSGTAVSMFEREWEFLNGFFWMPAPEQRPVLAPSQGWALQLRNAPSGAMSCSGYAIVEELY